MLKKTTAGKNAVIMFLLTAVFSAAVICFMFF